MLKLYIECNARRVSVFWVVGQWPEVRIFTRLYQAQDNDPGSIVSSIRWIVNNTPITSADLVYIDCKEYNLVDQDFWKSWGIRTEIERWSLPDKTPPKDFTPDADAPD